MAKKIYPVVLDYLIHNKQIDKGFIDNYIATYDSNFTNWANELDHLFTYRYIITDNPDDLNYFSKNYRYASFYISHTSINHSTLEQVKETPMTKVVIISTNNRDKLSMVKGTFPELKYWKYKPQQEFVHCTVLQDKTKLIIVNKYSTMLDELPEKNFKKKEWNRYNT